MLLDVPACFKVPVLGRQLLGDDASVFCLQPACIVMACSRLEAETPSETHTAGRTCVGRRHQDDVRVSKDGITQSQQQEEQIAPPLSPSKHALNGSSKWGPHLPCHNLRSVLGSKERGLGKQPRLLLNAQCLKDLPL